MTQEEKARAYDEALKDMRVIYPNLRGDAKLAVEHAFPELAESEDEKMVVKIARTLSFAAAHNLITDYDELIAMQNWLEKQKETGIRWFKSDEVKNPDKPYIDKAGMFYTTDGRMCLASEIEKLEGQKSIECIEFDNEFENQISHLLASVLNGEHEYNKDFVKYAAQSLLGYAKNELKSDELNEREKLMKALQTTNAQIGELVEENYKLKEQKPAEINEYEIIKKHITEDFLSSEVNKRLKECGWYVTDEKPAEWNLSQLKMFDDILVAIELDKAFTPKRVKELVNLINTCRLHKYSTEPTDWSEEDEAMIKSILFVLESYVSHSESASASSPPSLITSYPTYYKEISWLKSLRPQPKAELTLLDENIIDAAIAFVEQNNHFSFWGGIDKHMVIKALRSLKSKWKPTDEQMEALKNSAYGSYQNGDGPILRELYEQLKKLM